MGYVTYYSIRCCILSGRDISVALFLVSCSLSLCLLATFIGRLNVKILFLIKTTTMYKVTDELDAAGFSVNTVQRAVERNNGKFSFNTLEFFVIFIVYDKCSIRVEGREYVIQPGHFAYLPPYKAVVYDAACLQNTLIAFSSSFYEKSAKDSFILNSDLFFNSDADVFIAPSLATTDEIKKLIENRLMLYNGKEKGLYIAVAHNCVEILLLDGLLAVQDQVEKPLKANFTYIEKVNRFPVL